MTHADAKIGQKVMRARHGSNGSMRLGDTSIIREIDPARFDRVGGCLVEGCNEWHNLRNMDPVETIHEFSLY